ncbi:MAG: UDP-N-acetylmuramoyl-L-alanine--D-glutamate ligase [Oligoflexales bacterium]|nr:UDP-N-acetylmuramoyl-L-alanine--D-glutamate ligase [Oligoflexales bacterium]
MDSSKNKSKNVLVLGGGISGVGAARLLRKHGHKVLISDLSPFPSEQTALFRELQIDFSEGQQTLDLLKNVEEMVTSPGIPPNVPIIREAVSRGIPVISEIDLALSEFTGKLISVTGTNGKSTTCVMTSHILCQSGFPAVAGGNIGKSPSELIAVSEMKEYLVLELSSYQLETSRPIHSDVAIFTSFSFDHLGRHKTMENYFKVKWKLIETVKPNGLIILTKEVFESSIDYGLSLPDNIPVILIETTNLSSRFQTEPHQFFRISANNNLIDKEGNILLSFEKSGISEYHNKINAAFSIFSASHVTGKKPGDFIPMFQSFKPLPYRYQTIAHLREYPVINDSKSTNVESTMTALSSLNNRCILLLGGRAKDESFEPILKFREKIDLILCFGESSEKISSDLNNAIPIKMFKSLASCVVELPDIFSKSPSTILFSPGCASFDEFKNFEHRGEFFSSQMVKYSRELY